MTTAVDWKGRKFGELSPSERRQVAASACATLQAELESNSEAIAAILDDFAEGPTPQGQRDPRYVRPSGEVREHSVTCRMCRHAQTYAFDGMCDRCFSDG